MMSTQLPPQLVRPATHVQRPAVHTPPGPHVTPHIPQLSTSVCKSPHVAPHIVRGALQTHRPAVQEYPSEQTAPHTPQFIVSLCGSTHTVLPGIPQRRRGGSHAIEQDPITHDWPIGQAVPHAPQLVASVCGSTHRPLHTTLGRLQLHVPAAHATPDAHSIPQLPQLALSVRKSTQLPRQVDWPSLHGRSGATSTAALSIPSRAASLRAPSEASGNSEFPHEASTITPANREPRHVVDRIQPSGPEQAKPITAGVGAIHTARRRATVAAGRGRPR